MFKNKSKALFVCAILATVYVIVLMIYFGNSMGDLNSSEEIGGAIATALVTPHMIVIGIGAIFSWIGFFSTESWPALVGAILYCVGTLLFIIYALFCIPMIILGFVGYSKQKRMLKKIV